MDAGGKSYSWFRAQNLKQGLILVVIVALVPFAVVSGMQGAVVLDSTRAQLAGRLQTSAEAIAERERDPFIIARHTLATLAEIPEIRTGAAACSELLRAAVNADVGVTGFARVNAEGRPVCASEGFDAKLNYNTMPWWRDAERAPGFTVSNPVIGPILKKPIMAVVLPVTVGGVRDGTVNAAVGLESIQRSLNRAVRSSDAVAALVSEDGEIILSTSRLRFERPNLGVRAGPQATIAASDGSQWLYAVTPLERKELFVMYAEPAESIMTPTIRQLQISLLLPLVAMLFASLAIWFGTDRWVVRWLRRLGGLAGQFAGGDFRGNETLFRDAPEEVAALSTDLHAMAREIEARDKELMRALEIKTELTREIHHRVKNNLQIVMSLLTMQEMRADESDPVETLSQTRSRIAALALIHRLLYQQEDNDTLSEVGIDNLLGELCQQLRTANRKFANIELKCDIVPHAIEIDHAVPLALFVVEAVTNAYRHAFDDDVKGAISINFYIEDDKAVLTITDNGCGYEITDRPGRMGTDLMNAFADQLGGKATVASKAGAGTTVVLRFPALNAKAA